MRSAANSIAVEHRTHRGEGGVEVLFGDRAVHDFVVAFNEDAFAFDLLEERAGAAIHGAAELRAVRAVGDGEGFHRAGDADIEQPALLIDGALGFRALVRDESILGSEEEDVGELQALGGMQGDEGDAAGIVFFVFIPLAIKRHLVDESLQSGP